MKRLTLYMDEAVIKAAKKTAKQSRMSLSAVVNEYFRVGVMRNDFDSIKGLSPTVLSMTGFIPDTGKTDKEIREDYHRHIAEKYDIL